MSSAPTSGRIDLDPMPECGLDTVRSVAEDRSCRSSRNWARVVGRRTSGGSGLHIYVRTPPRWGFTDLRRAALAFARRGRAEGTLPKPTTTWWRKDRELNKVFVDYNQNSRDHTIASAYSVRGVKRATVSTPITWDEVQTVVPEDCTISTVPRRFAELGDIHSGIDEAIFPLDELLEWADRDEPRPVKAATSAYSGPLSR